MKTYLFQGWNCRAPGNDSQISLLETFADQAVIAIENARLFREIEEKSRQRRTRRPASRR